MPTTWPLPVYVAVRGKLPMRVGKFDKNRRYNYLLAGFGPWQHWDLTGTVTPAKIP